MELGDGNAFGFNKEANRMELLVGFFNIKLCLFIGHI